MISEFVKEDLIEDTQKGRCERDRYVASDLTKYFGRGVTSQTTFKLIRFFFSACSMAVGIKINFLNFLANYGRTLLFV